MAAVVPMRRSYTCECIFMQRLWWSRRAWPGGLADGGHEKKTHNFGANHDRLPCFTRFNHDHHGKTCSFLNAPPEMLVIATGAGCDADPVHLAEPGPTDPA